MLEHRLASHHDLDQLVRVADAALPKALRDVAGRHSCLLQLFLGAADRLHLGGHQHRQPDLRLERRVPVRSRRLSCDQAEAQQNDERPLDGFLARPGDGGQLARRQAGGVDEGEVQRLLQWTDVHRFEHRDPPTTA